MRVRRWLAVSAAVAMSAGALTVATPVHADAYPPFISAQADWLTSVNYFRAMAGLGPVYEDSSLSPGAASHSCYMLLNDIAHDEVPGNPGYTAAGDISGNASNVAVSSSMSSTSRSFVELWMTGPFHAIGILRPNLERVGYGECRNSNTATWHSAATLDVLHGLGNAVQTAPILFPGDGTVTNLTKFIAESPNPVSLCGWGTGGAGLPVLAMMPEGFSSNPTATMTGPSGPVQTCVLSSKNTSGTAQSILGGNNAVIVLPRSPLTSGVYSVTVNTSARSVSWRFTIDPAAADYVGPPPQAAPTSDPTGWQAINPARFVDSRSNIGATRLLPNTIKKVHLTGRQGLPDGAAAISANFTVTAPLGGGYLTVWNCSSPMPNASTLNFGYNDTVPNAANIPLDTEGNVCLYSPVMADIIIDVFGYFDVDAPSKFVPIVPDRVMDTRLGLGVSAARRMTPGQIIELPLPKAPTGATGTMLNVTTLNALTGGYITVYPCGDLPPTSSVNPVVGGVTPNTVTTALSARKSVCIYSASTVDVIVDVFGYMVPSTSGGFTPSAPFRWMDTRSSYQADLNFGTMGFRLGAGKVVTMQIRGQRGVPTTAKAVSFNITVTDGAGGGYITAFPCGSQPPTSNHNFGVGKAVANGATVALSSSGQLCLYTSTSVHVILDVNGWWS